MIYDTIISLATANQMSALSLIRISGSEAISLTAQLFTNQAILKAKSHTIHYGRVHYQEEVLDEVLVSLFRAPKSFTTEDVVEITCHGGVYVSNRIIEAFLAIGARLALPGEFTQRAYLNGRIDLTQAEGIMDLIEAKSKRQLALAHQAISGSIRSRIEALQNQLLEIIAVIEVNIDYPEYDDVIEMTNEILLPKIATLRKTLSHIADLANDGKIIREGIKTAIIGKPNVGKSSLLNTLLQEERAIVTEISGTTRDVIEGELRLGGLLIRLIDTAGIRDTEDVVEKIGIARSKKAIEEADLVLLVLDQSQQLTPEDQLLLSLTQHKKRILVGNKADLPKNLSLDNESFIPISAKHQIGIDALESALKEQFARSNTIDQEEVILGNRRHIGLILQSIQSLQDAYDACKSGISVDFVEIDLRKAWTSLGEITGDVANDSLINALFSRFCLGK